MNNQKYPQIRWHLSRETARDLEAIRKSQGYRSWDEFFHEWLHHPEPQPEKRSNIQHQLDEIQACIERNTSLSEAQSETLRELAAALDQILSALQATQTLLTMPEEPTPRPREYMTALEKRLRDIGA